MTRSKGKRPFHYKNVRPIDPNVKPIKSWFPPNQGFYDNFRKWMRESGCTEITVSAYSIGPRFAMGFLDKPYWILDPQDDLDAVLTYLERKFDNPSRMFHYRKGLCKFAQYLRLRQNKPAPVKAINWGYYLDGLSEIMAEDIRAFLKHTQRNWSPERHYEASITTLSHLTLSLRWMAVHAGIKDAGEITPQVWYAYLDSRLADGISPSTLNGEMRALCQYLHFVQDLGREVCERFFLIQPLRKRPRLPKDVPLDQVKLLQEEIEKDASADHRSNRRLGLMDRAWFLLMLHCGLRTGEIRRLAFPDLDFRGKKARIEQSKGLKDRFVYLSEAVIFALDAYLTVRGPKEFLPPEVFIFRHAPLSIGYCGQRLKTYAKRCGVRVTPHQLRHTCATLLLNAGAPVLAVQSILGHQHIDTTLGYARLYDGTIAADYYEAMEKVEGYLPDLFNNQQVERVEAREGETL